MLFLALRIKLNLWLFSLFLRQLPRGGLLSPVLHEAIKHRGLCSSSRVCVSSTEERTDELAPEVLALEAVWQVCAVRAGSQTHRNRRDRLFSTGDMILNVNRPSSSKK